MATTAVEQGATLLNYAPATGLTRDRHGFVNGVVGRDAEGGAEIRAAARVVINAGGPFCDAVRRLADPGLAPLIAPSQGIHLVFDGSVLPGGAAIMVPHTSDGRVMFAIPWHGHTVVGTTDTAIEESTLEPLPFEEEIEFVLETASRYLRRPLTRADVLSVFVGIRPLVRSADAKSTAALSRDHVIHIDPTGLVTLTGGKWTTWRSMAEHCVNTAAMLEHLPEKPCATRHLNIHGFHRQAERFGPLAVYGSDALHIQDLVRAEPALGERLHPALPTCGAEVVWAARSEMARTVEDVLARRARALFLNARAAIEMAPRAAEFLARELGRDEAWREAQVRAFRELAAGYLVD
jgi:glycerol-3-phosphate dehydrogenase